MQEENGKGKPRFQVPSRDCGAVVCGEWTNMGRAAGSGRPEVGA